MTLIPIPGSDGDCYEVGEETASPPPLPAPKRVRENAAPPPPVVRHQQPTDLSEASEESAVEEHAPVVEEEQPAEQVSITEAEQSVDEEPAEQVEIHEDEDIALLPHTWTVPPILTGTNDLFIGTTLHHEEGDARGPLISQFIREVPTGNETLVRTFRADELSDQTFLDTIQKAFAKTMQDYQLAWTQQQQKQQRDKAAAEQKRKTHTVASPAVKPAITPAVSTPAATSTTGKESKIPPPVKKSEGQSTPQFVTNSLF